MLRARCIFAAVVAAALIGPALAPSPAAGNHWTTYHTSLHPLTTGVFFDFYLNDPGAGGSLLGTTGPVLAHGIINARVDLDGAGDGTLDIDHSSLILEDATTTIDFGVLGSIDLTHTAVQMNIHLDNQAVESYQWDLTANPPTDFSFGLDAGTFTVDDPTGFLATVLVNYPLVHDLQTDPLSVGLSDVLGSGIHGTAVHTAVSMQISNGIDLPIYEFVPGLDLYLRIRNTLGIYAAIPEPSSGLLAGLGLIAVIPLAARHRHRRRRRRG